MTIPTGVPLTAAAAPATTNPTSPGTMRSVTMRLSPNTRRKTTSAKARPSALLTKSISPLAMDVATRRRAVFIPSIGPLS